MSLQRKMRRQAGLTAYGKFKKNFRKVYPGEKPPTFKRWMESVRRPAAFTATPEEVVEHIKELSWDD